MKYEYKTHAAYRGYGWIEPLTDQDDSLIEDYVARRICDELNALQAKNERLEDALKGIRSLSSINAALNPSPFALTALLGDIHQIADTALSKEKDND